MITIVGTGVQQGDLTARGRKAIREATYVFSRRKMRGATEWASELFASASSFEEMDNLIASHLLQKEQSGEKVVFAVVGDGFCDNVGKILEQKTQINVIARANYVAGFFFYRRSLRRRGSGRGCLISRVAIV